MGSFAQRLRDAMQSAGLKAVDLHERTGISKASISEYLSGNYEPKQKNVYRLAEALHVAPSYLMGLSDPASSATPAPQKSDGLPELNARDERDIERDLEDMLHSVAQADYKAPGDEEDTEALRAALRVAMIQAKRTAKKKYTPRKYRK